MCIYYASLAVCSRAEYLPQLVGLELTEYLVHEQDYIPFACLEDNLHFLDHILSSDPINSDYRVSKFNDIRIYATQRNILSSLSLYRSCLLMEMLTCIALLFFCCKFHNRYELVFRLT